MKTYDYAGRNYTIRELAEMVGVTPQTMYARINYYRWSIEDAATRPRGRPNRSPRMFTYAGRTLTLCEWSRLSGVPDKVIDARLRIGWSLEQALCIPSPDQRRRGLVATPAAALDHGPGVSSDRERQEGTGAGSTARETPNITFSEEAEIA